ncbi:MAG: ATP-binding cassette domain-containing protein [Desulfomonilaceae bacterium]
MRDVNFCVPSGKVLGILGPVGSGKTTLVRTLNGLIRPDSGDIFLDGVSIQKFGPSLRKKVALVFQHPEKQLFEETVFKDIAFPLINGDGHPEADVLVDVMRACELVGLDINQIRDRSPFDLSSGEKRRVAIAGALVNDPSILILDEPASDVDPPSLSMLNDLIKAFKGSGDRTVIIVSHDMDCFLPVLDLLMVINQGEVACFGSVSEVCSRLRSDPELRNFLPSLGLLVEELRARNVPIPENRYDVEFIRDHVLDSLNTGRLSI